MKKIIPILLISILSSLDGVAQQWMDIFTKSPDSLNYFKICKSFYDTHTHTSTNSNTQIGESGENEGPEAAFHRWEHFWKKRIDVNGNLLLQNKAFHRSVNRAQQLPLSNCSSNINPNWQQIKIDSAEQFPGINNPYSGWGRGRVDCIAIDPIDSNTIFAGCPTGGLWKSIDGGLNWTCLNDTFPAIGISYILIDPNNHNNIYVGTGDRDNHQSAPIGIYKSIDGGNSWTHSIVNSGYNPGLIYSLVIMPDTSNILFAASAIGLLRSIDSGLTWSIVNTTVFRDLALKPHTHTIYALSLNGYPSIYSTSDFGQTFSQLNTGLPSSSVINGRLATTNLDSNYLYVLLTNNFTYKGLYLSTNGGNTFSIQSNTPNILGYPSGQCSFDSTDGQAFYDIAIAVSPISKNKVSIGGIVLSVSNDAGNTWYHNCQNYSIHSDIHWLTYDPHNPAKLWVGCDGGIFLSNDSNSYSQYMSRLIYSTQLYTVAVSPTYPNKFMTGAQDNGGQYYINDTLNECDGGDDFDILINNVMEDTIYENNGLSTSISINLSNLQIINFVNDWSNLLPDPHVPNILYGADEMQNNDDSLRVSNDNGVSWRSIIKIDDTAEIENLKWDPFNDSIIFLDDLRFGSRAHRGLCKLNRYTGALVVLSDSNIYLNGGYDLSKKNKNEIISAGQPNDTIEKIYKSIDGGSTWSDYTGSFGNLYGNYLLYDKVTNGIYLSWYNNNIYYRDSTLNDWVYWGEGLPHVITNNIDISYPERKLYIATYGRGVWKADLYAQMPIAKIGFPQTPITICTNQAILLFDSSSGFPSFWQWTVSGGRPAISNLQNPIISFDSAGTFAVTLFVKNNAGCDSVSSQGIINVRPKYGRIIDTTGTLFSCTGDTVLLNATDSRLPYLWSTGDTTLSIKVTSPGTYSLITTSPLYCPDTSQYVSIIFAPYADTIVGPFSSILCKGANTTIAFNDSFDTYIWSDTTQNGSSYVTVIDSGTYSVTITSPGGCVWKSPVYHVSLDTTRPYLFISGDTLYTTQIYSSYLWYWNHQLIHTGTSNYLVINNTSGYYQVSTTDSNGCNASSDSLQVIFTGIENISCAFFSVFPNPGYGIYTIQFSSGINIDSDLQIVVYDALGQKIGFKQIQSDSQTHNTIIDISDLSAGFYFLEIKTNNGYSNVKTICQIQSR